MADARWLVAKRISFLTPNCEERFGMIYSERPSTEGSGRQCLLVSCGGRMVVVRKTEITGIEEREVERDG